MSLPLSFLAQILWKLILVGYRFPHEYIHIHSIKAHDTHCKNLLQLHCTTEGRGGKMLPAETSP